MKPIRLLFCLLFLLSACSLTPKQKVGAKGGLIGGAVGAGAGAAVGMVIANGDVPASAMLGGAIGIPVGVFLALYMHNQAEIKELERNNEIIINNRNQINLRRKSLEDLREDLDTDTHKITAGTSYGTPLYVGPTIGSIR